MRAIGEGTVHLLLEILNGNRVTPVSVTLAAHAAGAGQHRSGNAEC